MSANYTVKCNRTKEKLVQIFGIISLPQQSLTKDNLYIYYYRLVIEENCCLREYYKKTVSFSEIATLVDETLVGELEPQKLAETKLL